MKLVRVPEIDIGKVFEHLLNNPVIKGIMGQQLVLKLGKATAFSGANFRAGNLRIAI